MSDKGGDIILVYATTPDRNTSTYQSSKAVLSGAYKSTEVCMYVWYQLLLVLGIVSKVSIYRNINKSIYRNIKLLIYRNIKVSICRIARVSPSIPWPPPVFDADTERKKRYIKYRNNIEQFFFCLYRIELDYHTYQLYRTIYNTITTPVGNIRIL